MLEIFLNFITSKKFWQLIFTYDTVRSRLKSIAFVYGDSIIRFTVENFMGDPNILRSHIFFLNNTRSKLRLFFHFSDSWKNMKKYRINMEIDLLVFYDVYKIELMNRFEFAFQPLISFIYAKL